jgi:hypothetical protein
MIAISRELAVLNYASRMLVEAKSLEEIKPIRDKAEAARNYAKAAKLRMGLQNCAAEVKLRAERKARGHLQSLKVRGGDRKSKYHDPIDWMTSAFRASNPSGGSALHLFPMRNLPDIS